MGRVGKAAGKGWGQHRCVGVDNTASVSIDGLSYGRLHQSKRIIHPEPEREREPRSF